MTRRILTALVTTSAALILTAALAQVPPANLLSFDSYLDIQAAANFTDGYVQTCPDGALEARLYGVCVWTGDTGWSPDQLRDFADFGLSAWTVFKAWREDEHGWKLTLIHRTRNEMLLIGVARDGNSVTYIAGKL